MENPKKLFKNYKVGKVEDVYTQDKLSDDIKNPPKGTHFYGWRGKYKDKEYGGVIELAILRVDGENKELLARAIVRLNQQAVDTYNAIVEGRLIKKMGE